MHPLHGPLLPGAQQLATSGTTYNDTCFGTITLSGANTESWAISTAVSGTITLSGTNAETHTESWTSSGTITLGGSAVESLFFFGTPAGTISLSGSAAESWQVNDIINAQITLSGSVSESWSGGTITYNDTCSGAISASGAVSESFAQSYTLAGSITLGGALTESWDGLAAVTGQVVWDGSVVENYNTGQAVYYIVWNIQDHRVESLHETSDEAHHAIIVFIERSGAVMNGLVNPYAFSDFEIRTVSC